MNTFYSILFYSILFYSILPFPNSTVDSTVYPKKYAHGFCFAVLCCGYTLTDFPISIRLTSLAPWQSNDCPSASKATLMNMDKYFMWIHYERLHNHNKAKHNKTVCIFLGIYSIYPTRFIHAVKHLDFTSQKAMRMHSYLRYRQQIMGDVRILRCKHMCLYTLYAYDIEVAEMFVSFYVVHNC